MTLLRVLPERAIEGSNVEAQAPGELPREPEIVVPERRRIVWDLRHAQRPECLNVHGRIGTPVTKMKKRTPCGPFVASKGPQQVDLQGCLGHTELPRRPIRHLV